MVGRWHRRSCPWRHCLVTDTHDRHRPPYRASRRCPGTWPHDPRLLQTPHALQLVLRCPGASSAGRAARQEHGGLVSIRGAAEAGQETPVAAGRGGVGAAAGVGVPRAVSRPHLELHGARGQAVVAEPVVAQVVDQPVHILGERGQVLEGRGTAAAQPHTTPKPPTPLSHCFPRGVRGSADPLPDSKLSSFFAPHVSKSTVGGKERQLARP